MTVFDAFVLGLIEGLTEFLPVSSTGHLILASEWLGVDKVLADRYSVVIQLGAILAVAVVYWKRFIGLLAPSTGPGFNGRRGILLLALTSFPALALGKFLSDPIKEHIFSSQTVAIGLGLGGIAILLIERRHRGGGTGLDALSTRLALALGCIQCLALWPGVSRSAATILGAILLGFDRKSATEYSFFAAVPVLCAAGGYEILTGWDQLASAEWSCMLIGLLVAFVTAWAAIRFLLRYVSSHTFTGFAWYRIALALIIAGIVLTN